MKLAVPLVKKTVIYVHSKQMSAPKEGFSKQIRSRNLNKERTLEGSDITLQMVLKD